MTRVVEVKPGTSRRGNADPAVYLRDIPEADCDASFRGLLAGLLFSSAVWLLIIGLAAIARRLWPW